MKVWERHLVFHIDRTVDKLHKDEKELEKTKNQLLKLQLDLARAVAQRKPNKCPNSLWMTHLPLQLFPHIWGMIREQHTKHHGHRWVPGEGIEARGVGIWDLEADVVGGGGRQRGACHLCGGTDHWKNECPSQQGDGQFTGPPAGGWGPLRGGPGGRGRGTTCLTILGSNSTRLQPTYRRLCTQHGARRETRGGDCLKGPTEDHHEGNGWTPHGNSGWQQTTKGSGGYWSYILHCNKRHNTDKDLSDKTVGVMGFSGGLEHWPMTKQLTVQVVNQSLPHSFLYSSNAPVPLLGRDLLIKLGASILCSPQGV